LSKVPPSAKCVFCAVFQPPKSRIEFQFGEITRVFGRGFFIGRTIEIFADKILRLVGVEVFQIFPSQFQGAFFSNILADDGHWRFGQNADARSDDLEFIRAEFLQGEECLIFPSEKNIADAALHKCGGGAARACVEHGDVLKEGLHEILNFALTPLFCFLA